MALPHAAWLLRFVVGLIFVAAGIAKLARVPAAIKVFSDLGSGSWFLYLTAVVEIVGAILVMVRGTAAYGGILLGCTMASAALVRITLVGGSAIPAVILLIANLVIVWIHRNDLLRGSRRTGQV